MQKWDPFGSHFVFYGRAYLFHCTRPVLAHVRAPDRPLRTITGHQQPVLISISLASSDADRLPCCYVTYLGHGRATTYGFVSCSDEPDERTPHTFTFV